jgi:hypothetical protein
MVVLHVSYTYMKVQVSTIGLILPKKKFPMTLNPWMGLEWTSNHSAVVHDEAVQAVLGMNQKHILFPYLGIF